MQTSLTPKPVHAASWGCSSPQGQPLSPSLTCLRRMGLGVHLYPNPWVPALLQPGGAGTDGVGRKYWRITLTWVYGGTWLLAPTNDLRSSEKGLLLVAIFPVGPRAATNAQSHYLVKYCPFWLLFEKVMSLETHFISATLE